MPAQPTMMVPPSEEPVPRPHALPANIDYQALAAAISSVANKPPSPAAAAAQPEAAYVTDPMQIPLPPPLSPDTGEVTPQNPEPVSSPTLDSTEETMEQLPAALAEADNTAAVDYDMSAVPVMPSPSQQQLPPPAAAVLPPATYTPAQQAPLGVPYAVVSTGPPAGMAPAAAPGAMYPANPQPVATSYGPGYGAVGPNPAPGTVQGMPTQVYYLPHVATAMSSEQPAQQQQQQQPLMVVPSMETSPGRLASPPPQVPAKKTGRLPPHWKTAKDEEGNTYYYHTLTRETQWDPPTMDETDQDMELGTPTYDEPKVNSTVGSTKSRRSGSKKKAVTVAADTSEVAKKIKELFRSKISSHIVHCLNPFRKPDCKLGRIQSTEDFKHLARKLTHFVMAKELKHCKNVEDLECNENVKHKAKEFIQKYMAKYGPVYRKDKTVSPKDD